MRKMSVRVGQSAGLSLSAGLWFSACFCVLNWIFIRYYTRNCALVSLKRVWVFISIGLPLFLIWSCSQMQVMVVPICGAICWIWPYSLCLWTVRAFGSFLGNISGGVQAELWTEFRWNVALHLTHSLFSGMDHFITWSGNVAKMSQVSELNFYLFLFRLLAGMGC